MKQKGFSSTAIVIMVVIVAAVAAAGYYLYTQGPKPQTPVSKVDDSPQALEAELNTQVVEELEADFSEVDRDLQTL